MLKGWDSLMNRKGCDRFIDGSSWKKICHDKYYDRVKELYRDSLVKKGESYAIFKLQKSQLNELMIFFRLDQIQDCTFVKALDMNKFQCMNQLGRNLKNITTNRSILACLPYRFHLSEELYSHCAQHNKVEVVDPSTSTILYYANIGNEIDKLRQQMENSDLYRMADRTRSEAPNVILLLSVLLLIVLLRFCT